MTLASPAALWGLLLIPLVVLLYMLRARREPRVISSTLLWERATRDLVARLPMRRLERSLLLLVQILVIAAAVLALARPSISLRGFAGDAVAVVIDVSASMQATDVRPSRFAAAQREALALLGRLGSRQPAALVAAGVHPRVVAEFTTDHASVAGAIRALEVTDGRAALDEAVAIAASLRWDGRSGIVYLFGDRQSDRGQRRAGVRWVRIGQGGANAGITAVHTRADGRGRAQMLVRVEAFGGSASRTLIVEANGRQVARRPVRVHPGTPGIVMVDLGEASGVATARLDGGDALPADDRAVVAVGREGLGRVLVVGDPDPVLDAVLAAVPTAGVVRAEEVAPAQWGQAHVVVLDRVPPVVLPPGSYMLFGTIGTNLPLQIEGTAGQQVARRVTPTHPVMRLADLRGVRVAETLAIRPEGGLVLAEGDVPLVWAYEGRGLRVVLLPFDLARSDLPLHPAFPVMIANAVDWLTGSAPASPGASVVVPAGPWPTASLRDPLGREMTLDARDGVFAPRPFDRVGVYTLRTGGWERRWVVPTVDREESSIEVDAAVPERAARQEPSIARARLSPWLLAAAAALMLVEWWLWARTLPRRRLQPGTR